MLASKNRLRAKNDINNVFKKGRTVSDSFIFLRIAQNDLNANRFAFIVSKKVSSKSVIRNKIKRQLREAIKKNILKIKQGYDFLIIAKPLIVDKDYKAINEKINEIFNSKINKIVSR